MRDLPNILSLAASDLGRDPRVARQRLLLQSCGRTWSAGFGAPGDGSDFIPLAQRTRTGSQRIRSLARLLLRQHAAYANSRYWLGATGNLPNQWDLIVANDVDMLPLAFALAAPQTKVLFDAHEYAPREFEDRLYWRILYQPHRQWLCERYLSRVNGFVTVCDGIANEYARGFRVARPLVVPNAAPFYTGSPRPTDPHHIRLIHHGLASSSRRIEVMIDLMAHLDRRFTLDLMLVSSETGYVNALKQRAAHDPRITFIPPVPTGSIVAETRRYDIGLFLLPPTNLNYRFALPNKFFEFIQARLAVAIGPSPEMARLVERHAVGVVAADFAPATLGRQLNALDAATIDRYKQAANDAAAILSWEAASAPFLALIKELVSRSCAA